MSTIIHSPDCVQLSLPGGVYTFTPAEWERLCQGEEYIDTTGEVLRFIIQQHSDTIAQYADEQIYLSDLYEDMLERNLDLMEKIEELEKNEWK